MIGRNVERGLIDLSRNTVLAKSEDGAADLGVPMPYLESAGDDVRRRGQIVKVLSQYAHHEAAIVPLATSPTVSS